MISKLIKFCKDNNKELFLIAVIILVAVISFGLGRLSKIREEKMPITIEDSQPAILTVGVAGVNKIFVASRNGKKYYYAWCESSQKIKESNRIWFSTKEEAEKSGYEPAANCRGLK